MDMFAMSEEEFERHLKRLDDLKKENALPNGECILEENSIIMLEVRVESKLRRLPRGMQLIIP